MNVKKSVKTKKSIPEIQALKNKRPIVCLTSYTKPIAEIANKYADIILVGDSLGMVLYGYKDTLPVTLDMMIQHGKAVVKSAPNTSVLVDLPFGSYEYNDKEAFDTSVKIMKEVSGCVGIKLEGGKKVAKTVKRLTSNGIPVMGHIGLLPQSINKEGSYKVQGKRGDEWLRLQEDAEVLTESGAFCIVLETIVQPLAEKITKSIPIPTIGIGSSVQCNGQILVTEDLIGLTNKNLSFVKKYSNTRAVVEKAIKKYAQEVRNKSFPGKKHSFGFKIGKNQ